jgi:hypothetical protein
MKFRFAAVLLALLALLAAPVGAIIWAGPDGERHPYVGVAQFYVDGEPTHICSGTLLSSMVFLTAGHCTTGTDFAIVLMDSVITQSSDFVFGLTFTHPDYGTGLPNTHDVGVISLLEPWNLAEYGVLPEIGQVSGLERRRGLQNQLFTIVGYGDQAIIPTPQWAPVRYYGTPQLVELDSAWTGGYNIHVSGNNGQRAPGGVCFGDSGGPALIDDTNIVAGVGSFVLNYNCTGAGFYYRVDTAVAQAFILPFLE